MERYIVDATSLARPEAVDLMRHFRENAETESVLPHVPDGTIERRGGSDIYALLTPMHIAVFVGPTAAYATKKAIDVLAEVAKAWMLKRIGPCEHRRVEIVGPYGDIVKIVECDVKHADKA